MARPNKEGLDYFPLDVDFFETDKTELISAEFGIKGELIMVRLLTLIYKNGYFYEWNDEKALLLAKRVGNGFTGPLVGEIVSRLAKRSFFDEGVLNSFGVLTSKNIQNNYLAAVSRRANVEMIQEYCLVDCAKFQNVVINSIYVNNNGINDDNNTQSKVEESKVEESIESDRQSADTSTSNNQDYYQEIFDYYLTFENLINHRCITQTMKESIDKAIEELALTKDELFLVVERHSIIVELTKNDGKFAIRARPLYELFGQKAFGADHLLCAEYLDDGSKYKYYLIDGKTNNVTPLKRNKANEKLCEKSKKYTEEELEDKLLKRRANDE